MVRGKGMLGPGRGQVSSFRSKVEGSAGKRRAGMIFLTRSSGWAGKSGGARTWPFVQSDNAARCAERGVVRGAAATGVVGTAASFSIAGKRSGDMEAARSRLRSLRAEMGMP